jgi:secreted PhoX family phosphatase
VRPRKHTALGRFRHENTAFRHEPGKRFVLYSGDDRANEGFYKFVSDRSFRPGRRHRAHNLQILESGTLYVARFEPEGRRRSRPQATSPRSTHLRHRLVGRGARLRAARHGDHAPGPVRDEWDQHFALNRPEDVEVAENGTVYLALTNNSTVKDSHGSVRRLREARNDPEAMTFKWRTSPRAGRRAAAARASPAPTT